MVNSVLKYFIQIRTKMKKAVKILFFSLLVLSLVLVFYFLFSSFFVSKPSANAPDEIVVNLPKGRILGRSRLTPDNKIYYAFQEVPFAAPPVGDLRFKEPVEPQAWTETKNCTTNTKQCIQFSTRQPTTSITQSEDCLYLNVYTPLLPRTNFTDKETLPVLFWLYGGSFKTGDASYENYNPDYLIEQNIVVVIINYRVGPFGFLATGDNVIPGNLGLKDQHFALKWAQSNIQLFGGDPSGITLVGQSAGAASVGYHLTSKKSAGLFRAAIFLSGTSISSWANQYHYRYYAYQLCAALDPSFSTSKNSTELLEFLQNFNASDIKTADDKVAIPTGLQNTVGDDNSLKWAPIIESESYEGAFITNSALKDVKNGNINQVPILIGFNSEEFIYFMADYFDENYPDVQAAAFDANRTLIVNNCYDMTDKNKLAAGEELSRLYTNNGSFVGNKAGLIRYFGEMIFATGVMMHADLQSAFTDVYLYELSYRGPTATYYFKNVTVEGTDKVGHPEFIVYMFNNWYYQNASTADKLTTSHTVKMVTNFIKYLNPTPEKDHLLNNVLWPKVTPENLSYLNINNTLSVETGPKLYRDWKRIIQTYSDLI